MHLCSPPLVYWCDKRDWTWFICVDVLTVSGVREMWEASDGSGEGWHPVIINPIQTEEIRCRPHSWLLTLVSLSSSHSSHSICLCGQGKIEGKIEVERFCTYYTFPDLKSELAEVRKTSLPFHVWWNLCDLLHGIEYGATITNWRIGLNSKSC